jgi:hypothetical protein
MKTVSGVVLFLICVFLGSSAAYSEAPVSDATQECLDCHAATHPGIVESWKKSRHGLITPAQAMADPEARGA